MGPQLLLVFAVAAVGVLHTIVPDHWLPIALIARQEGWTQRDTARAAAGAGLGHALSTLAIGFLIWLAGAALAVRFAGIVDMMASLALIGFGLWIVVGSLQELRSQGGHAHEHPHHSHSHTTPQDHHGDGPSGKLHTHAHPLSHHHPHGDIREEELLGHRHKHQHADGRTHTHYHTHIPTTWHAVEGSVALAVPLHEHDHRAAPRRTLLLILGSSPMVEGLPAFFAASHFGFGLISAMALVFTLATVLTYVVLCVSSAAATERVHLGPIERYGEVLSGAFIAAVGIVFLVWIR